MMLILATYLDGKWELSLKVEIESEMRLCHSGASKNDVDRAERERQEWGGRISHFVIYDNNSNVEVEAGREHSKDDEYGWLWMPTVMHRLEWSGTE